MCIKGQKQCPEYRTDGSITKTRRATHQELNPRGGINTSGTRAKGNIEPSVKPPALSPRVEITKPDRPRIQLNKKRMSVNDANIEKSIQNASNKRTLRVPLTRVLARSQHLTINSQRRAQLIHNKETGEYLNYQQLPERSKFDC